MFNGGPDAPVFLGVFYKSVLWRRLFSFRNRGSSSIMGAASCIFHVGNVMENLLSLLTDSAEVIHKPPLSLSFWVFIMFWYIFWTQLLFLDARLHWKQKYFNFVAVFT